MLVSRFELHPHGLSPVRVYHGVLCVSHTVAFPIPSASVLFNSALVCFRHTLHAHVNTSLLDLLKQECIQGPIVIRISLVPTSHLLQGVLTHPEGLPSKPMPLYLEIHFHLSVEHFVLLKPKAHLAWEVFSSLTFLP